MSNIHPTAIISGNARVGDRVSVGPFSIIHDGVILGDGCQVGSHCELGVKSTLAESGELHFGPDGLIRSHSIFYIGSSFGPRLATGHRVTVRENTFAGENLQIGTLSDIQGHCRIGDFCRLHSNVHIGQKSEIGSFVWIFPYVVLTNDPHPPSSTLAGCKIGDYTAVATMSVLLPGVSVSKDALIGAGTIVRENVPEASICVGNPGRIVGSTSKIKLKNTGEPAYPWRRHFTRGYPEHITRLWSAEFETSQS